MRTYTLLSAVVAGFFATGMSVQADASNTGKLNFSTASLPVTATANPVALPPPMKQPGVPPMVKPPVKPPVVVPPVVVPPVKPPVVPPVVVPPVKPPVKPPVVTPPVKPPVTPPVVVTPMPPVKPPFMPPWGKPIIVIKPVIYPWNPVNPNPIIILQPAIPNGGSDIVPVAQEWGMKITEVAPNGAAAAANLQVGHIIVSVGDKRVQSFDELTAILAQATGTLEFVVYIAETQQLAKAMVTPVNGRIGVATEPVILK